MIVLYLLLCIAATTCFLLAAFNKTAGADRRRINLVALGLFFFSLVPLIQSAVLEVD